MELKKSTIKIMVEMDELDKAVEKAKLLKSLLLDIKQLIRSLSGD